MTDVPSWAWTLPFAVLFLMRPRLLLAIVRGLLMLAGAVVLAVFAGVCL